MIKKRYIALTLMLYLLSINKAYASTCTESARQEFNQIQNQYKITTTYNDENKTYNMKIETANTNKFGYVFTIEQEYSCNKVSDTVTECTGLKPGISFYARVIGMTNECNDLLKEEEIKLIRNNEYYGDPLCEGIEEFVLCQKMYDKEIDRETFEERIEIYKEKQESKKEEKKKQQEKEQEEKISNTLNETINYIKENFIQVVIVIIFIILVAITTVISIITARKRRRLE